MKHLQERIKQFALQAIRFCNTLPRNETGRVIGRQLLRSATSVGANYRAACREQSRAAFLAKLSIVEEKADESAYWLELLEALGLGQQTMRHQLKDEAVQLTAIIVASKKTCRRNSHKARNER